MQKVKKIQMHFTTLSSQKIKSATWQWLMQARCGCPTLFSGEKKWKVVKILIRRIIYWKPWNILFVCDLCKKVLEIMEVDILYYYIDENFHFQKWKDREVPRDIDSKSLHQGVSQRWCPLQYKVDIYNLHDLHRNIRRKPFSTGLTYK